RGAGMRFLGPDFVAAMPCLGGRELGPFRLAGPGLGNMLFPWARAQLWARSTGAQVLAPTWPQLKLGPILRRERDLRLYSFQFRAAADELTGLARATALAVCRHVDEAGRELRPGFSRAGLVRRFAGLGDYFSSLPPEHGPYLLDRLTRALRDEVKPEPQNPRLVAVHIRCGDFRPPPSDMIERVVSEGLPAQMRMPLRPVVEAILDAQA